MSIVFGSNVLSYRSFEFKKRKLVVEISPQIVNQNEQVQDGNGENPELICMISCFISLFSRSISRAIKTAHLIKK